MDNLNVLISEFFINNNKKISEYLNTFMINVHRLYINTFIQFDIILRLFEHKIYICSLDKIYKIQKLYLYLISSIIYTKNMQLQILINDLNFYLNSVIKKLNLCKNVKFIKRFIFNKLEKEFNSLFLLIKNKNKELNSCINLNNIYINDLIKFKHKNIYIKNYFKNLMKPIFTKKIKKYEELKNTDFCLDHIFKSSYVSKVGETKMFSYYYGKHINMCKANSNLNFLYEFSKRFSLKTKKDLQKNDFDYSLFYGKLIGYDCILLNVFFVDLDIGNLYERYIQDILSLNVQCGKSNFESFKKFITFYKTMYGSIKKISYSKIEPDFIDIPDLNNSRYILNDYEIKLLMQPTISTVLDLNYFNLQYSISINTLKPFFSEKKNFLGIGYKNVFCFSNDFTVDDYYIKSIKGKNIDALNDLEYILNININHLLINAINSNIWIKSISRDINLYKDEFNHYINSIRNLKNKLIYIKKRIDGLSLGKELHILYLKLEYTFSLISKEKLLLKKLSKKNLSVSMRLFVKMLENTCMYRICYFRLLKKEIHLRTKLRNFFFSNFTLSSTLKLAN